MMPDLRLKDVILHYAKVSPSALELLEKLAVSEHYSRGEYISKQGQFNQKEYLVLSGVCRSCLYSPDGIDTTLSFFTSGMVLSPYVIRTELQISNLNIQASTDLTMISFNAKAFEQLMVENLEVRDFGNEVLKRELAAMYQKEIAMASLTARDRLLRFRSQFKQLENQISHAEIASYLGITTISLSRLRRELMS
jgi:CRP-like cAMP-binding protein